MATGPVSVLWRRLDSPGHDACHLEQTADGWTLTGAAAFAHDGLPARLSYQVSCDPAWRTRDGVVRGRLGERAVDCYVAHLAGTWTLNDVEVPGLERCVDLDFGFTPATNLIQLRRINLAVGHAADVPVAWLDVVAGTLGLLEQRYERRDFDNYWYQAPRFDYAGMLEVAPSGFARKYPGLWEAVA